MNVAYEKQKEPDRKAGSSLWKYQFSRQGLLFIDV
jgi:hypothetical protein